jgi:hypothetical protein
MILNSCFPIEAGGLKQNAMAAKPVPVALQPFLSEVLVVPDFTRGVEAPCRE